MADLVLVAVIVAFTALCVGYIGWCDRIIGPGELDHDTAPASVPGVDAALPVEVSA